MFTLFLPKRTMRNLNVGLEGLKSIQREEIKIDEKVDQEIPFPVSFSLPRHKHEKNIFAQKLSLWIIT